ncbi:hypothetical protein [Nostoc favosum]|uniref:hypothetical protein n=1 Tax=Nostoc favosum TaxID=2907819 RepID=UPI001E34063D|nr:hypothetical protein [Nostoc favosum]
MTQHQASQPLLRQAYASSLGKVMGKVTHNDFYQLLEDTDLPYAQLIETNSPLNTIQRSIVFNWMENFHNSIVSNGIASNYLGLSINCAELVSTGVSKQSPSNLDVTEDIESEKW